MERRIVQSTVLYLPVYSTSYSLFAYNTTITDAKNRKFKLLAPQEEKRIGTFVIIQEDGSDKWGIISKNHIRNFFRVFPEE